MNDRSPADRADEACDQLLMLDGPYDPDSVRAAAIAVDELTRRLCHASYSEQPYQTPRDVARVIASLMGAQFKVEQVLLQLTEHVGRLQADPRLYDDGIRPVRPEDPRDGMALAIDMLRAAASKAVQAATKLDTAKQELNHLGFRTEDQPA